MATLMARGPLMGAEAAVEGVPSDPDAPGWRREPIGVEGFRNDILAAAGMFGGGVLSLALSDMVGLYTHAAPIGVALAIVAAGAAALAFRRRYPAVVLPVESAVFIASGALFVAEFLFLNIYIFLALYSEGAWDSDRRRAAVTRAVCVAAIAIWVIGEMFREATDPDLREAFSDVGALTPLLAYLLIQALTLVVYFAAAYFFGGHAFAAARARARASRDAYFLAAEREAAERRRRQLDRLAIARELHDAVAHHVSLMGVQAGSARLVMPGDPERARDLLEGVEESARAAIEELGSIVHTLRAPVDDESDDAPSALGVSRLPALVAAAKQPAVYQVVGEPTPLPPLTSLNLYRVAQEALTNVRKHAGPDAMTDVRLRYLDDAIELEVVNTAARGASRGAGTGLGVLGMRERIALDGGELTARVTSDGGYLVRALVPLPASARAAARLPSDAVHARVSREREGAAASDRGRKADG